jgi:hypothetical protein
MLQNLYETQNMAKFIYLFNKLRLVNMEEYYLFIIKFVKTIRELVNQ